MDTQQELEQTTGYSVENQYHNANLLDVLPDLPNESVDTFILDPPYMGVVKDKWDNQWKTIQEYSEWCESWIAQLSRISKKSGSVWLFGFPYQLAYLLPIMERHNFRFRQQIVIWKGMKSAAGRVSGKLKMYPTTTESIFFFNYDSIDIIRNMLNEQKDKLGLNAKYINEYLGKASNGGGTWSSIAGPKQMTPSQPTRRDWGMLNTLFNNELPDYDDYVFNFKLPLGLTDVWDDIDFYRERKTRFHTTQKPTQLISRLLDTSCRPSSIVLDPFMGSGTTAICAIDKGVQWIGCEQDPHYYDLSTQRIIKHLKPDPQRVNFEAIFGS
jgi:adenine-specific DNA-methyltransferase